MSRLLVVDDDIQMLSALEAALRRKGHTVETASNGFVAISKLEKAPFQAIITDLRMPGMDGLELLQQVRRTRPSLPVVVLSAYGTVPTAVDAMKAGLGLLNPGSSTSIKTNLAASIRARFAQLGGVELAEPTKEPMREPLDLLE